VQFPLEGAAVPVIFDCVVPAAGQQLGDLDPLVAIRPAEQTTQSTPATGQSSVTNGGAIAPVALDQRELLRRVPGALFHVRVEVVEPSAYTKHGSPREPSPTPEKSPPQPPALPRPSPRPKLPGVGGGHRGHHRGAAVQGAHRSRHCFPTRPGRCKAIAGQFLAPYTATSSTTLASSSGCHAM
jgi:hypothetical protein